MELNDVVQMSHFDFADYVRGLGYQVDRDETEQELWDFQQRVIALCNSDGASVEDAIAFTASEMLIDRVRLDVKWLNDMSSADFGNHVRDLGYPLKPEDDEAFWDGVKRASQDPDFTVSEAIALCAIEFDCEKPNVRIYTVMDTWQMNYSYQPHLVTKNRDEAIKLAQSRSKEKPHLFIVRVDETDNPNTVEVIFFYQGEELVFKHNLVVAVNSAIEEAVRALHFSSNHLNATMTGLTKRRKGL